MTTTKNPPPQGPHPQESMGIDPYEKNWIKFSVALLLVFATAVTVSGFALGYQLPGDEGRVDPRTILNEGPFSTPGLREIGENKFEAYIVARQYLFDPGTITIPAGASIDLYITTPDVQHGFKVTDTNINMQIVPGQVSKLSFTFDRVGEYPIICHEFCGEGHAAMFGTIEVVPPTEFEGVAP
ncbi:MAG: cytochrome c oxidase subunit II [Acidimicrobiia bacterium]